MTKWININEKPPDHEQIVLVITKNNRQAICIYLDGKKQTEKFNSLGFPSHLEPDFFEGWK